MDIYASDPILIAAQQLRRHPQQQQQQSHQQQVVVTPNGDIMELCRIFLLNYYLKQFGRARVFQMLEREHLRNSSQVANISRACLALAACLTLTWFLQSRVYNFLARQVRRLLVARQLFY